MERMGKLIELYNKHLQDRGLTHKCVEWEVKENINMLDQLKLFVKRLVENDKIDLEEVGIDYGRIHLVGEESGRQHIIWQDLARYEALLMLLSISDTPIDDLISYLK